MSQPTVQKLLPSISSKSMSLTVIKNLKHSFIDVTTKEEMYYFMVTEDNWLVMVTRTDDVDDPGDMAKVSLDKYHQSRFQTIFIQSGLMQIAGDE